MDKPLTDRAKFRLKVAAGLLRSEGVKFDCPRDQFYESIQATLAELPEEKRASLRELVDWIEDYERASSSGT